jgi:Fic family protein
MDVRLKGDLTKWFKFFLVGIIETAKSGIKTFDGILQLQKQIDAKIQSLGSRAGNAQKIMLHLYQRPIIHANMVASVTGISAATGYKLLADLENLGILKEVTGAQRGKLYVFKDYLEYFN